MSIRRVDLGTAVRAWRRGGDEIDGVVVEVIPAQKFPRTFVRGTFSLDYRIRYVIANAGKPIIRALDKLEVVAL